MDALRTMESILSEGVERGASDLHINSEIPPSYRINGKLQEIDRPAYPRQFVEEMIMSIMSEPQQILFKKDCVIDMGYAVGGERFRINAYREMGKTAICVRHLDSELKSMDELGLPIQLHRFAYLKSGLVLVCGATGSGKSTTLASILNEINEQREVHILTVEDPVEFVYTNKKSLVHQRELHTDVIDFAGAIRSALRQDPDVILIGEMRDLETMRAALTAAETGHLVFSSLHTGDAVGVVERLVGAFPAEEQDVVRTRVALALKGVVAQHLLPTSNGKGRAPACEVLVVNKAVSNLIEGGRSKQIYSTMESSRSEGMQTLDQSLANLVADGRVDIDVARSHSRDPSSFAALVRRTEI